MEHPAAEMYAWLVSRMYERAQSHFLPIVMPDSFSNLSVRAYRTGEAGYILYEALDSLAGDLTEMAVRVQIEYDYGYTKLGMGESYTQRMLANEIWTLTHNAWNIFPEPSFARDIDATIRHKVSNHPNKFHNSLSIDQMDTPPVKIQEDNGRGTMINNPNDQAHLLQYWTWSQQPLKVCIGLNINDYSSKYWLDLTMQLIEDVDDGKACPTVLQQLWLEILHKFSPHVAQACDALGSDFSYKVRHHDNIVKIWYTPRDFIERGLITPLAEQPTVKDKWVSNTATVLTYPPMPPELVPSFAQILLGGRLQEQYPDPEVQGGHIAHIASNNNIVQRPPNSLDRMHASLPKQVADNQHELSAEDEIAGINTEVGSFLSKMSILPNEPIVICLPELLHRHTVPVKLIPDQRESLVPHEPCP
jgi:hypothetical protein